MKILQLPRCALGMHQRDRRRAWHDGPLVRSHCTGCGKPMIKDGQGWHLAPRAIDEAAAAAD